MITLKVEGCAAQGGACLLGGLLLLLLLLQGLLLWMEKAICSLSSAAADTLVSSLSSASLHVECVIHQAMAGVGVLSGFVEVVCLCQKPRAWGVTRRVCAFCLIICSVRALPVRSQSHNAFTKAFKF